jgi:Zn-dependent M16 (insulinase) family peptidase
LEQYPVFLTVDTHERPIFAAFISRKWAVHSRIQKSSPPLKSNVMANGFILLEVLVAMSLVASSWMGLSNTYQRMILRLGQLQEKKAELRKEMDRHELTILAAAQLKNSNPNSRKLADESIGVSRRSRPISSLSRTTHKK